MAILQAGNFSVEFYDAADKQANVSYGMQGVVGARGLNGAGINAVLAQVAAYMTTAAIAGIRANNAGFGVVTVGATGGGWPCANVSDGRSQANSLVSVLANPSNWA